MNEVHAKIQQYFAAYHLRAYNKGHVLLFPGDTVEYVFYLVDGSVKQYSISKRGNEVILNIFKPGAFFPMANVINNVPAKYMIEVETNAKIRLIPADEAVGFLKENPDVLYDLLGRVYKGTEGLLGRLEHLMSSGAAERFIYELLIEAKRFGKKSANGEVTVLTKESSIGQRAGLSRETVNRQIQALKAENLIQVKRNAITIPDLEALERLVQ